jgi:hypothetical protein
MSCCRFLCFSSGLTCGSWKPIEPASSFVASFQLHSAVPVKFHNHKDSVMRVAGILQVRTMHSRVILWQAKEDYLDRVHSDQMVLKMIRRGGWSSRAIGQWRLRVSKLGLKRLSEYYSNEIAVEAAGRGGSGPNERVTLTENLLKGRAGQQL